MSNFSDFSKIEKAEFALFLLSLVSFIAGILITFVCWIKNFFKGPLPKDWRIALIAGLSLMILLPIFSIIMNIVRIKENKNHLDNEAKEENKQLLICFIAVIIVGTGLLVPCALILGKVLSTEAALTIDKVFALSPLIFIGIVILLTIATEIVSNICKKLKGEPLLSNEALNTEKNQAQKIVLKQQGNSNINKFLEQKDTSNINKNETSEQGKKKPNSNLDLNGATLSENNLLLNPN